ncbi:MAG TPA: GNVR domain-containing protein [Nitrospiria bacterium]|nr:GNVR domain-containing protein [Nitrospiria bacterium]
MPSDGMYTSDVDDEINFLDYWRVVVKYKTLIAIIVSFAIVISIVYSLLLPNIYASTASILPPQPESPGIGSQLSQLSGGLGGMAGGFLGIKSPADLWVGILKSETVQDAIITKFNLIDLYKAKTMGNARAILRGMVKVAKSKEDIISITVEDKDPARAALLANAIVEELDRFNKNIVMTSGGRMRSFVEKRLIEAKGELTKLEDVIKAFQEENKAVKLYDQSKAIIEAIGTVKGQLMAKEVELQTFLSYATPYNPQAEILTTQVEELKERLKELAEGKKIPDNPTPKDIFIPTTKIPDLALQYARLLRDTKVQETLYGLLIQQYEIARIQEAKDSPTVQVLDTAKVPEKRIKPKRRNIVLLSAFTATFLAIFLAFFLEYIKKVRTKEALGTMEGLDKKLR